MQTLNELFENTLRDIYYAEKAILKALPKLAKKASSSSLADAFRQHAEQTEGQVTRLEEVFELIGKRARGKRCPAIDGLLEEGAEVAEEAQDDNIRDAAMLAAAQAVEHYEIARYGALISWAEQLGNEQAMNLLRETLEEEKQTDETLTQLAEEEINTNLNGDDEENDEDEEEDDDSDDEGEDNAKQVRKSAGRKQGQSRSSESGRASSSRR